MLTSPPNTDRLATTRLSWHVLAGHVLAEERWRRTQRIGLHPRPEGLRTPEEEPSGVELAADRLVLRRDGQIHTAPVTTLAAARRFVLGQDDGATRWAEELPIHDPPPVVPADSELPLDTGSYTWLGTWFRLGDEVLRAVAADAASVDSSSPTLWPEHLDIAVELLPQDQRASYGLSTGDEGIGEPYAYVSVWYPDRVGGLGDPRWDSDSFPGAVVTARELAAAPDPARELLDWFRVHRVLLAAAEPVAR